MIRITAFLRGLLHGKVSSRDETQPGQPRWKFIPATLKKAIFLRILYYMEKIPARGDFHLGWALSGYDFQPGLKAKSGS